MNFFKTYFRRKSGKQTKTDQLSESLSPQDKILAIKEKYDQVLLYETEQANYKVAQMSYTNYETGHNIGRDQQTAIKYVLMSKTDSNNFKSAEIYSGALISELENLRDSYVRANEDPYSYGVATVSAFIRGVKECCEEISIIPVFEEALDERMNEGNEHGDYFYELSSKIEDAKSLLRRTLLKKEYLIASDCIQILVILNIYRFFYIKNEITEGELLLFSTDLKKLQSLLIALIEKGKIPKQIVQYMLAWIFNCVSLLSTVRKNDLSSQNVEDEDYKLPIMLFGGNYSKALEFHHRKDKNVEPSGDFSLFVDPIDDVNQTSSTYKLEVAYLFNFLELHLDNDLKKFCNSVFVSPNELLESFHDTEVLLAIVEIYETGDDWKVKDHIKYVAVIGYSIASGLSITFHPVDIKLSERVSAFIEMASHAARFGDSSGGDLYRNRQEISKILLDGMVEIIHAKETICIYAEGIYSQIPFNCLCCGDGSLLVENHKIKQFSHLISLQKRNFKLSSIQPDNGSVIANPKFTINEDKEGSRYYADLPESQLEAEFISSLMGWDLNSSTKANYEQLKLLIGSKEALHLATHGDFDGNLLNLNLLQSLEKPNEYYKNYNLINTQDFIVLAGANNGFENSIVNKNQLLELDLTKLKFIYLSLCLGASGSTYDGENAFGLVKVFTANENSIVIANVLPIPDDTSKEIAILFYKNFSNSKNVFDSLREAQLSMLKNNVPWYECLGYSIYV